jgi:cyclase
VTSLPVIASGGAGTLKDFLPAVEAGSNAVLAASVFHSGDISIGSVKQELRNNGVKVRM